MTIEFASSRLIILQGAPALSEFRKTKLCNVLQVSDIEASFIHIAEVSTDWCDADSE